VTPTSKHINGLGKNISLLFSVGVQKQERLRWRGPTAIFCSAVSLSICTEVMCTCSSRIFGGRGECVVQISNHNVLNHK
jgi:hypothetical protein